MDTTTRYLMTRYPTCNGVRKTVELDHLPTSQEIKILLDADYIELFLAGDGEEGEDDYYCDEEGALKGLHQNSDYHNVCGPVVHVQRIGNNK